MKNNFKVIIYQKRNVWLFLKVPLCAENKYEYYKRRKWENVAFLFEEGGIRA